MVVCSNIQFTITVTTLMNYDSHIFEIEKSPTLTMLWLLNFWQRTYSRENGMLSTPRFMSWRHPSSLAPINAPLRGKAELGLNRWCWCSSHLCYISHFNVIPFFCLFYFNHDLKCLQALRKELTQPKSENLKLTYYPMTPIGVIHSCFSTRLNAYSFIIPFKFYN